MPHIVVLGGGFAGTTVTRELERLLRREPETKITIISRQNYMVFTPLLAEVAGNSIEPRHSVPPLRAFLKRARFHQGEVRHVDVQQQVVTVEHADSKQVDIHYDYLVIAVGAVTNYHHAPGAADYSYDLKSLDDAIRLRNHILATLELADVIDDPVERAALLTFVGAGGGYAGIEGLGQMIDFVHKSLRFYPTIKPSELRFMLVSHGNRLLDQIDERLGQYVIHKLRERGVDIRLGVSVTEVTSQSATFEPGGVIPTCTVLWAAGISVNPLIKQLGLPLDRRGALKVDATLRVVGHPNIFAFGDCAAVPKGANDTYAPTAQNALREGKIAASNIVAAIKGRSLRPFAFTPVGSLATIGNYQAVAQIWNIPISGLPAWLAWRGIYLFKLPGLSRKIRVTIDWILEAVLPTDIVQLPVRPSDDTLANAAADGDIKVETPAEKPGQTEVPPTAQVEAQASGELTAESIDAKEHPTTSQPQETHA